MRPFVLASASPRRADLLRAAGFVFDVRPADIDETLRGGESPAAYVRRLSQEKAAAVAASAGDRVVLAADTVVVLDRHLLGKPRDDEDAGRMLALLSGRRHEVMTGVTVLSVNGVGLKGVAGGLDLTPDARGEKISTSSTGRTRVAVTGVEFARLSHDEISWYVASGEPRDKAGAYAIQGLASRFVTRIDGSYSNVVGLPVEAVYALFRELGFGPELHRNGFRP